MRQNLVLKMGIAEICKYEPSEGQLSIHLSDKRHRIVVAGNRFGKSMFGGFEALAGALAHADFRVWICGPVYELADREFGWVLDFAGRYKLPDGRNLLDVCDLENPKRGSRKLSFPNGSFVQTKSCEHGQYLLGEELDLCILAEAAYIPRDIWDRMLNARLRPRLGGLICASTGCGDSGLLADFLVRGRDGKGENGDWQAWKFRTIDNPHYPKEEYEKAKRELDPDVFREQFEGELVSRSGYVFKYNPIILADSLPHEWQTWNILVGIQQAGCTNPTAVIFVAYDHGTRSYWCFDEFYKVGATYDEIVDVITEKVKGLRYLVSFVDYWDKEAQEHLGKKLVIKSNDNEKGLGKIQAIISRIRILNNLLNVTADKPIRVKIVKGKCPNLEKDFEKCKWPMPNKEEKEQLEATLPRTKYFQCAQALSHVLIFMESNIRG